MKLHDSDRPPAFALAVLIAAGYMTDWPHEWTKRGMAMIRKHCTSARGNFHGGYYDCQGVTGEACDNVRRHRPDSIRVFHCPGE